MLKSPGITQSYFHRLPSKEWENDKINIKRSYDIYSGEYNGKNFNGDVNTHNKGKDIVPNNEGKWDNGVLSGRVISEEWSNPIKSLQVPVGLWATLYDEKGGCELDTPLDIDYGKLNVYWGMKKDDKDASERLITGTDFDGKTLYPEYIDPENTKKIPEPIATVCSVGKNNTNKKGNYLGSDNQTQCWVGASTTNPGGTCLRSGLHLGSYCQLGENINSEICKNVCENIGPDEDHFCNWSKERLCNKGIDENVVGNEKAGKWWFKENICQDFCSGSLTASNRCFDGWTKFCSDNKHWLDEEGNSDKGEKCANVYKALGPDKFNENVFNKTCEGQLETNKNKPNIFEGNCSGLCKTIEKQKDKRMPLDNWCIDQKKKFCSKPENMKSAHCLEFVRNFPDESEDILRNFCSDVVEVDDMNENVLQYDTNQNVSKGNWCGCVATDKYYENYIEKLKKELNLSEYQLDMTKMLGPKACYGSCARNDAPKPSRIANEKCPDCVETIINNIGSMTDSTIKEYQNTECGHYISKKEINPPSSDKPDKPPSSGDDKPSDDIRKKFILAGYVIIFILLLLIVIGETKKNFF